MIPARIERFISTGNGTFDELALELLRHQYRSLDSYRAVCDRRGVAPDRVRHWREAPLASCGESDVGVGEPSSSTLLDAIVVATLAWTDLSPSPGTALLSLAPRAELPTPSLALLGNKLTETIPADNRVEGWEGPRLSGARVRSWLAARQRDHRQALVLTTPERLRLFVDYLEKTRLRFRLPATTRVVEFSDSSSVRAPRASPSAEAALTALLGLLPEARVRYLGWRSLTSAFLLDLQAGNDELFVPPPWVAIRVVDSASHREVPAGQPGQLAVLDLAAQTLPAHQLLDLRARTLDHGFQPVRED